MIFDGELIDPLNDFRICTFSDAKRDYFICINSSLRFYLLCYMRDSDLDPEIIPCSPCRAGLCVLKDLRNTGLFLESNCKWIDSFKI